MRRPANILSTLYYETEIAAKKAEEKASEGKVLKEKILKIFNEHRKVYGTRELKGDLLKLVTRFQSPVSYRFSVVIPRHGF